MSCSGNRCVRDVNNIHFPFPFTLFLQKTTLQNYTLLYSGPNLLVQSSTLQHYIPLSLSPNPTKQYEPSPNKIKPFSFRPLPNERVCTSYPSKHKTIMSIVILAYRQHIIRMVYTLLQTTGG